jgi:hypothetical protein
LEGAAHAPRRALHVPSSALRCDCVLERGGGVVRRPGQLSQPRSRDGPRGLQVPLPPRLAQLLGRQLEHVPVVGSLAPGAAQVQRRLLLRLGPLAPPGALLQLVTLQPGCGGRRPWAGTVEGQAAAAAGARAALGPKQRSY